MDGLRMGITIAFAVASIFGAIAVCVVMFDKPIVLLPVGAALCGFISYFLMERERGTGEKGTGT